MKMKKKKLTKLTGYCILGDKMGVSQTCCSRYGDILLLQLNLT